jgi:hypothetical protein
MPSVKHWPGEGNPLADDTTRSFHKYNSGPKSGDPSVSNQSFLDLLGNGKARTWRLPTTKRDPMCAELRRLGRKLRIHRHRLEKLTGKLINATRIAPSARGLMTPFFKALHSNAAKIRKKDFDLYGAMRQRHDRVAE